MSAAPRDRQPWPMKWIVLAILLCIVPYTFINLRYRKAGPAYQPYEDMKNRANVSRLLSAGYKRIALPAQRPADPLRNPVSTTIASVAGGLPEELRATLVESPLLPAEITNVAAPGTASAAQDYAFRFACTLPDQKRQLAGADLYVKDDQIVVTPDYEKLSGGLTARTADNVVQLTIPAGALAPGRYRVTLVGQKASRAWSLEVK